MKKPYIILSTLIQGPKSPGNDIDTYLQPLIYELKELWEVGVKTYDAFENKSFQLHAALSWTINDFPAYGNLSGWCVYGRNACPCCNTDKWSKRYKHSGKVCYMGHRRFLSASHRYRNDKTSFDNTKEVRLAPKAPSGSLVLEQLKNIKFTLGKTTQKNLSGVEEKTWKKKSIFFNLPYWEHNILRHNLDVMHIEKNVCDNIINTLLNVPRKSKDNLKAHRTLEEIGVRKHLWPQPRNGRLYLAPAPYSMSSEAKDRFCEVIKDVKFPDGYASNISRTVQKRKLSGLKSHDCHVLMQLILPLAVRESLHEKVASILIELCDYFRALCSKTLYISELDKLETNIATILCNLEKLFPPTFFTIMVHLVVHFAAEARIGGPVQYRWMYPIERFLSTLKSYVGNKARPEGLIAETYLIQECLTFCSRYLEGAENIRNRSLRNNARSMVDLENSQNSSLFVSVGQPSGRVEGFLMDEKTCTQAHRYVLFNCDCKEIEALREEHISFLKRIHRRSRPSKHIIDRMHSEEFIEWLKVFVNNHDNLTDIRITEDVRLLARGPLPIARRFQAFDMKNGYKFRTKEYEKNKTTQNSGVKIVAKTQSYASSRDKNPILGDVTYYGILTDIIELNYYGNFKIPMFRCDWVNVINACGLKKDKLGFTLVNFSHLIYRGDRITDEPFVFAAQVDQVIYVRDLKHPDWLIPRSIKPRTFELYDDIIEADFDVGDDSDLTTMEDNFDILIDDLEGVEDLAISNFMLTGLNLLPILDTLGGSSSTLASDFGEINQDDLEIPENSATKKCRGPTILADIWIQPSEEKYVVKFNSEDQPYGDESSLLASFIGTIGRNPEMAPQGYSDWRLVPKEYKVKCMNEIKLRFEFPRRGEDHIRKAIGRAVKDFRAELKAMYYEPNKHNRATLVSSKPPRVPNDQWLKLFHIGDKKKQRRATINRNNQKNQMMPHCAARQSFAQLRAKKAVNGVEPSRAVIFIDTHKDRKSRDKKKIDEKSAVVVGLMKEKLQELPNGIEETNGKIAWNGDIFDQVIGKTENRGRVRGVGGGVCASKLWGHFDAPESSYVLEGNEVALEMIQKLLQDMETMKQKQTNDFKAIEQKHATELQAQQEKHDMELQTVLERQSGLESRIYELLNLFKQRAARDKP